MIGEAVRHREGWLQVTDQLRIRVQIIQERQVYGRTDYLVSPIDGDGTQWVQAERVDEF